MERKNIIDFWISFSINIISALCSKWMNEKNQVCTLSIFECFCSPQFLFYSIFLRYNQITGCAFSIRVYLICLSFWSIEAHLYVSLRNSDIPSCESFVVVLIFRLRNIRFITCWVTIHNNSIDEKKIQSGSCVIHQKK